jgi:hypothetical protein
MPLVAGLVVLLGAGVWAAASSRARVATQSGSGKSPACKVVGNISCAASACHNAGGPKGTRGSEYSTYINVDPHAKAFQTLSKPESRGMHEKLARAFPDLARHKDAAHNPLCLDCHGMGGKEPERLQSDGVGCERCHGPAGTWISTHYVDTFRPRLDPCFHDLRSDLVERAAVCTKCHVGDANQEVDHVLIAAGHPRLRFEYGAYYANYSTRYRHWADLGEKSRDPAFEVRSWMLGQLVSARAALELLVARASVPEKSSNWPEFAEYDCAACHHGLQTPSPRQKQSLNLAGKRRAGDLPWGTWYYPLLPTLAPDTNAVSRELKLTLDELHRLMRLRYPPPAAVTAQARKAIGLLDKAIVSAREAKITEPRLAALMKDLAGRTDLVDNGWDGGTQVYLALAALHQARGDGNPRFKATSPLRKPLIDIRKGLQHAFEPGARALYDTPNAYGKKLDQIFKGLAAVRGKD